MICAISIEVAPDWVRMEGNEYNILQSPRDDAEGYVFCIILENLLHEEKSVFNGKMAETSGVSIDIMKRVDFCFILRKSRVIDHI